MAKFFITNNKDIFNGVVSKIKESPFKMGFIFEHRNLYAVSVKKLFLNNENAWCRGTNMVITTGTPIYKESLYNENILDEFDGDVNLFRKNIIGQYAISIKRDDVTIIFCDAIGAYSIYYYNDGVDYLVSNDIIDMAKVLGDRVKSSDINILEEVCQNSILCGDSLYEGIRRLRGYEKILISEKTGFIVEKLPIQKRLLGISYSECVKELANRFKYKAGVITKVLGNPDIFMTGGLDARISLASYLSIGAKPSLHYGVGDSVITNTKKNDLEIAKIFSHRYNLPFYEEDWSTPSPIDKYWDKYIAKYGVYAKNYAASDCIMKSFESLPNNISTFGYGGELYRNLPWIENRKKKFFTAEEFVDEYYIGGTHAKQLTVGVVDYRDMLIGKIKKLCEDYGLDPNRIDNKDNMYLLTEYRSYADTYMLNMMNQMRYSNLLLLEQDCLELTNIPIAYMNYSKFMLDIIKNLYEDVLEVPIFSHCVVRQYDKDKGVLAPEKLSFKRRVSKYIPDYLIAMIRKIKHNKTQGSLDPIEDACMKLINQYHFYPGFCVDPDLDLRCYIHYAILLKALK